MISIERNESKRAEREGRPACLVLHQLVLDLPFAFRVKRYNIECIFVEMNTLLAYSSRDKYTRSVNEVYLSQDRYNLSMICNESKGAEREGRPACLVLHQLVLDL